MTEENNLGLQRSYEVWFEYISKKKELDALKSEMKLATYILLKKGITIAVDEVDSDEFSIIDGINGYIHHYADLIDYIDDVPVQVLFVPSMRALNLKVSLNFGRVATTEIVKD